jgi:flagellar hook-associated protein 2
MSSVSAVNTLLGSTTSSTVAPVNISSILAATVGATTPGIDVTGAVAAAIAADRAPEDVWNAEITTLSSQTSSLAALQTATTAITTDLEALNSLTGPLAARTVSSSSSDVTATAAMGAVTGGHTLVVDGLATTGAWYSDLESSATATLPATSFTLATTAGATATITTGAGVNTLNDLATTINGEDLGVTATVVSDTTGSRLAIISNASGTAADFSITSANDTGTSWSSPDIPAGDTLGANSFTLTSSGVTTTISTTTGETYATLATKINAMDLGVTATAGSDANGTNLSIASSDGSTPFTISEPTFGFTQAVTAANASLVVDGIPIQSASNTVTGAIPGVTLTLLNAEVPPSTTNLTVASDATAVSTAINQFVTDYNTAIGLVNAQYVSTSTAAEGVLASDPTVVSLQSTLEQAINYVNTPASGTTTVSTLNDLGISAGADGILTVDSTALDNALTNDPTDVQNFFEGASLNGFANSMNSSLTNFTDPSDGAFTVDLSSISSTSADLTAQISDFETNYIANQQTVLTAMYSAAEIALQQLPTEMAQIQAELGNSPSTNGG